MAYQQILNQFNHYGVNGESQLTEGEVRQILDRIAGMNNHENQFDREIEQQLWEYTLKNNSGKVKVKDYVQTIVDARAILAENIEKSQKQLKYQQNRSKQEDIQECLLSYREDLRIINSTFRLSSPPPRALDTTINRSGLDQNSEIFTVTPSPREESTSLKLVFLITFAMLLLEIFCMYVKHHFTNILVYIAILSVFFLNYFDSTYMKSLLVMIVIAIGFDIAWMIVQAENYWNQPKDSQYSHHQSGLLGIIYILTLFMLIAKVLVLILLFRFRNNDKKTRKSVVVCGFKADLNGGTQNDPISLLFTSDG